MAALCPGLQYGLSSQDSFSENKDLIFVKLTDSALRAIEEYLRNKNKFSCQSPTIKFLGNEGQLAFPSSGSTASFSFSMSSTQDMEGPGGSFECLRQTGPPRGPLEVLGSIPYKIRVHANDDVYAATRQRMTVAEENQKNKCTREIKPNQTDIGRKVKVKQSLIAPSNGGSSNNNGTGSGRLSQILPTSRSSNLNEKPNQTHHPSMRDSLLKNSYSSPSSSSSNNNSRPVHSTTANGQLSNGLGSNHVSSTRPQNKPTVPDILKRPIKERLIHMLAIRPYKKVEIFERLNKEGLREKGSMSSVLKQIAFMKDNAYHLKRDCWNDVRENWPFYSESEKQILKRRKPQNLTPPGSSDSGSGGSSGSSSGQSPTSTHPGSPPPPVVTSTKRPGYYDGVDGFPTKRQRISHYRKPTNNSMPNNSSEPPPVDNKNQRRPITDSRDSSNMNPRSRESPTTTISSHYTNGFKEKRAHSSDNEDGHEMIGHDKKSQRMMSSSTSCDSYTHATFDVKQQHRDGFNGIGGGGNVSNKTNEIYRWNNADIGDDMKMKYDNRENVTSSIGGGGGIARVSPDSQSELLQPEPPAKKEKISTSSYPDYLTEYTPIKSYEQRKRYKSDFNDNYAEYKDLHGTVEKVSRRFAELEERLKQEDMKSPRYKDIKKQIMKEYKESKKNLDHQKAKARFQYLHDKLSHIKQLVKEYDKSILSQQYRNDRY